MTVEPPDRPARRRVPVGLLVFGGSVLASFLWWLAASKSPSAPATEPAAPPVVESAPPPAAAPETTPERPAGPARAAEPAPPKAAEAPPPRPRPLLRVGGDVDGADVFVDRTFVGKTPFESRDITPGSHQINVSAAGYDGVSQRVEVAADAPTEVTFALKAVTLDAAVDVVHKHRLGSCEGRLTADLTGIRFTPARGDDGFSASLDSLDVFTLEYQERTLKLKPKGGRSYSFTTRAANADPLLVFHRDVEKARAKLGAT